MAKSKKTYRVTHDTLEDFKKVTKEAEKLCLQSFDSLKKQMEQSSENFSKEKDRIKKEIEKNGRRTSGFIV